MKKLLVKSTIISSLIVGAVVPTAQADQYLIDEMESLKESLEKSDPDRAELSLRLADLYFDVSIQESSRDNLMDQREKAYNLYMDVLNGRDNIPKPSVTKANIIRFQLARVLGKLNRHDDASDFYKDVYNSKHSSKKLKRESAFSLAEYFEEKVHFIQADKFYQSAIGLCETHESKNYGHYKRAWLHYKEVKIDTAISELKLSLFEKDGTVREKVINDLLLFFSARMTNGEPELAYIRELITKTGQKDLVRRLVESYYGAGNRIAGSTILVQLNEETPDPFYEMRLFEEFYSFRDFDLVQNYLGRLEKRTVASLPKTKEEAKEFKAMLKRVIVQFDSEVEANTKDSIKYKELLKRSIDQYLVFYHNDDMRKKMQQGWLKTESSKKAKIARLKKWISEDLKLGFSIQEVRKLRQTRLSLAQEEKFDKIVLVEANAIAKILKGSEEAREFNYVEARILYKQKKYDQALSLFLPLTDLEGKTSVDNWALQSQHLALDIFNVKKDYKSIIEQSDAWLNNSLVIRSKALIKDRNQIVLIRKQAAFEAVTALGQTKEALASFYDYCLKKVYEKKSCSNAKILAVKLADQEKLVSLLEKSGDEISLMSEYELMGRFSDAAKLQEKYNLNKNSGITAYLKIAVLFEIDQDFKERDRILKKLIRKIRRDKEIDKKYETAIYKTLEQADLLNSRSLLLPWSVGRKISLANRLSIESPSKLSTRIIAGQKEYSGSTWSKIILGKVQKSFSKVGKTKFYGRNSKRLFKRRVKNIDRFVTSARKHLEGSDSQTRIYILDMLKIAYLEFGNEILNTPLPDGLTEDILLQVRGNLNQMATPYMTLSTDYERLQTAELNTLELGKKNELTASLNIELNARFNYVGLIADDEFDIKYVSTVDFSLIEQKKILLNRNPMDINALEAMESHFKLQSNPRIASYFTGRINSINENNVKEVK